MATISILIKQALKKPSMIKALAKYTGRQILRRTGVFGTFGTMKRFMGKNLTKLQFVKAVTGSIIKKNTLRALGPLNYAVDLKKGGVKYALKQFGFQHMTPMAVKKLYYLSQNYKSLIKKPITEKQTDAVTKEGKKRIWKELDWRNNKHSYSWKIDQIQHIAAARGVPQSYKEKLLNNWFHFRVHSKSGNFAVREYAWHPITGTLIAYVRSGGNHRTYGPYYAFGVPIEWIKQSIKTSTYGKKIYWVYYHKSN